MKSFALFALGALFSVSIAKPLTGPVCDIVCPETEGLAICDSESSCGCCPIEPVPIGNATLTTSTLPKPTIVCDLACALPLVFCAPCGCCEANATVTKSPIVSPTRIICDIACPLDEEICEPCSCCGGPIGPIATA